MRKRKWIIVTAVIVILTVAGLIYLVPWVTPVNMTLEAVKVDADGNELGTVQIHIDGAIYDYLFQADRLDAYISPFDDLTSISLGTFNGVEGGINSESLRPYLQVTCTGWQSPDDMVFCTLGFSEDLDRWMFRIDSDQICYVASVSGDWTTEALIEYFESFVPVD